MPSFRYLAGARFNFVEHGVLASTNEDSSFPRSNLYLGRPRKPFRFNDTSTNPVTLTIDINGVVIVTAGVPVNAGDFTTWAAGHPQGWAPSAAAPTVSQISPGRDGSGSNIAVAGATTRYEYLDITVRSGQARRFTGYLRRGTSTATAAIRIQNLQTGNYLTGAGAWQAAAVDFASNATTSWVQAAASYVVESLAACGYRETVTLRIYLMAGGAGSEAWYDDVYDFPGVDFASIHGHNIDAQVAAELQSSDDNSAYSTEHTFTKRRPAFYGRLGALAYHRWWRYRFNGSAGANSAKLYFFPVLGQQTALSRIPTSVDVDTLYPQTRNETGARERFVHNHSGDDAPRTVNLSFMQLTTAQWEEVLLDLFGRAQGGAQLGVFVVLDDEPMVVHGRINPGIGIDRVFRSSGAAQDVYRHDLAIMESTFPVVTA